jgi:hypothetical protein
MDVQSREAGLRLAEYSALAALEVAHRTSDLALIRAKTLAWALAHKNGERPRLSLTTGTSAVLTLRHSPVGLRP